MCLFWESLRSHLDVYFKFDIILKTIQIYWLVVYVWNGVECGIELWIWDETGEAIYEELKNPLLLIL